MLVGISKLLLETPFINFIYTNTVMTNFRFNLLIIENIKFNNCKYEIVLNTDRETILNPLIEKQYLKFARNTNHLIV